MIIKIDAFAAASFEQDATSRHGSLTGAAQEARAALEAVGLSTQAASLIEQLAGHVQAIGQEFGAASRRAVNADAVTFTATNLVPNNPPSGPTDAATAEAIADAEEYAEWLLGEGEHGDLDAEIEKTEEIAAFLEEHEDNPEVLKAFFDKLGPEGVLEIPERLARLESWAARRTDFYPLDENGVPKISRAQHDLMKALGNALGNASTAGILNKDFDAQLVGFVVDSPSRGWALSEVLRNGTYEENFLITIGNELDKFEQEYGYPRMWLTEANNSSYSPLGFQNDDQYFDPFVGLFEAMGRTPDAALRFLYPAGMYPEGHYPPGKSERAVYYIKERTWSHDDFDALGQMLEGAALAHRTHDDPRAQWSANAAADAINLLAAREGSQKIGDGAYDSLGNILGSYILNVDVVSRYDATTASYGDIEDYGWRFDNLPPGAAFDQRSLEVVLAETLTNAGALETVLNAAGRLNGSRIAGAISKVNEGIPGAETDLKEAIRTSNLLAGTITGLAGFGNLSEARRDDERAKLVDGFLKDVASAVPVSGTFASFITSQTIKNSEFVPSGFEDAAKAQNWEYTKSARQATITNTGVQLGRAGLLEVFNDGHEPYPWFDRVRDDNGGFKYVFNPEVALNKDNYTWFRDRLRKDQQWGELFQDLEGDFNDGVGDGHQGD